MPTYAAKTDVSTSKSRDEIERTLARYGAEQFAYGWSPDQAVLGFVANSRQIRFILPLPDPSDREFTITPTGLKRSPSSARAAWEQACRAQWRALSLVIKAKLQAVESGIVTFEDEFAMHMVLPGGATVREHLLPALAEAYETGEVPTLLNVPRRRELER
jgi:hypothetical protein